MSKRKVEAEKQIKLKRSLSNEKKLSGSKGKMSNFSPKKNSWTQKNSELKLSVASSVPSTNKSYNQILKIPHHGMKNSLSFSSHNKDNINNNNQQMHSSAVSNTNL